MLNFLSFFLLGKNESDHRTTRCRFGKITKNEITTRKLLS